MDAIGYLLAPHRNPPNHPESALAAGRASIGQKLRQL